MADVDQRSLFQKFDVRRTDGTDQPGGRHHGCEYFVLDLTHDPAAKTALLHYAQAVKDTRPELSRELFEKIGAHDTHNSSAGKFAIGDGSWPDTHTIEGEEFDTEEEALAYIAGMSESDRNFYANTFVLVQGATWYPPTYHGADITEQMHCQYGDDVHDGSDNIFLDDDLIGSELKNFENELDEAVAAVCRKWIKPALVWEKVRDILPDEVEGLVQKAQASK